MKIVILEDEARAANRLERQLKKLVPEGEIIAKLHSVHAAISWFGNAPSADVIFMDIDLGDGYSFEVLEQVEIQAPIIFTTAFDQYAVKAFQTNGIGYLLKPIREGELAKALQKLKHFTTSHDSQQDLQQIMRAVRGESSPYQQRFLIRLPNQFKSFDVQEVAYFFIKSRITFLKLTNGKSYSIDFSLDQLDTMLNPARFFRLNRQFTVSYDSIAQMIPYPKSRIKLLLDPPIDIEIIVSSEKSAAFKRWLQGIAKC